MAFIYAGAASERLVKVLDLENMEANKFKIYMSAKHGFADGAAKQRTST